MTSVILGLNKPLLRASSVTGLLYVLAKLSTDRVMYVLVANVFSQEIQLSHHYTGGRFPNGLNIHALGNLSITLFSFAVGHDSSIIN